MGFMVLVMRCVCQKSRRVRTKLTLLIFIKKLRIELYFPRIVSSSRIISRGHSLWKVMVTWSRALKC